MEETFRRLEGALRRLPASEHTPELLLLAASQPEYQAAVQLVGRADAARLGQGPPLSQDDLAKVSSCSRAAVDSWLGSLDSKRARVKLHRVADLDRRVADFLPLRAFSPCLQLILAMVRASSLAMEAVGGYFLPPAAAALLPHLGLGPPHPSEPTPADAYRILEESAYQSEHMLHLCMPHSCTSHGRVPSCCMWHAQAVPAGQVHQLSWAALRVVCGAGCRTRNCALPHTGRRPAAHQQHNTGPAGHCHQPDAPLPGASTARARPLAQLTCRAAVDGIGSLRHLAGSGELAANRGSHG